MRYIHCKIAYDSAVWDVLYNIFIEFWLPKELLRLNSMYLKDMYCSVHTGKHLYGNFPIQKV
jgi:hypothetical protein